MLRLIPICCTPFLLILEKLDLAAAEISTLKSIVARLEAKVFPPPDDYSASTIATEEIGVKLTQWMHPYKLGELLFRASEHSFVAAKFHELCDNRGATLLLAKADNQRIFGGFTTEPWTRDNNWKERVFSYLRGSCQLGKRWAAKQKNSEVDPDLFVLRQGTVRSS